MLSHVRQLKGTVETLRGRRGKGLLLPIIFGVLIFSGGCAGAQSTPANRANVNHSPAAEDKGFITSIDGEPFREETERYEGGYRVEIEGTCPDSSPNVYIVVRPQGHDYFQIQPRAVRTTRTSWIGQAFLGAPESGIGENFTIFAVFTGDNHIEGEKLEREPEGIKSAVINFTRTQN
jgi:hypothetical protein